MPEIRGNMTGVIADILVHKDDKVESGQDVMILESMKMHIPIQSDFVVVIGHRCRPAFRLRRYRSSLPDYAVL